MNPTSSRGITRKSLVPSTAYQITRTPSAGAPSLDASTTHLRLSWWYTNVAPSSSVGNCTSAGPDSGYPSAGPAMGYPAPAARSEVSPATETDSRTTPALVRLSNARSMFAVAERLACSGISRLFS